MRTNNSHIKQQPFGLDPNPLFYFHSLDGQSAYRQLAYRIRNNSAILLLVGERGVGKTTLMHEVATRLAAQANFVTRQLESDNIRKLIKDLCTGLGLQSKHDNVLSHTLRLTEFFSESKQKRIVFIIENADQLDDAILEKLLLLSISLSDEKLSLQIILVGLPDLASRINQMGLPTSVQYNMYCYRLASLNYSEVGDYIHSRLNAAEHDTDQLFAPEAISRIASYSDGKPSLINKICSLALIMADTEDDKAITKDLVDKVADILLFEPLDELAPPLAESALSETPQHSNNKQTPWDETKEIEDDNRVETTKQSIGRWICGKKGQYVAWGVTALFTTCLGFLIYDVNKSPAVATVQAETATADPAPSKSPSKASFAKFAIDSDDTNAADPIDKKTPSRARKLIGQLKNYDQPIDLHEVHKKAEDWSAQSQKADAFLLHFYAARRGDGNSAFKLAQLYDPTTFKPGSAVIDSPNLMQAKKWYEYAIRAGHPKAKQFLSKIHLLAKNRAALGDEKARRLILQFR